MIESVRVSGEAKSCPYSEATCYKESCQGCDLNKQEQIWDELLSNELNLTRLAARVIKSNLNKSPMDIGNLIVRVLHSQGVVIKVNIDLNTSLTEEEVSYLAKGDKDYETGKDKHLTVADLTFTQDNDIKIMKKIKSYKGVRHILEQPVRGQKTKSNFRKNKGKVHLGVKKKAGAKSGRP